MDKLNECSALCTEAELKEMVSQSLRNLWLSRSKKNQLAPEKTTAPHQASRYRGREQHGHRPASLTRPERDQPSLDLGHPSTKPGPSSSPVPPIAHRRQAGRRAAAEQQLRSRSALGFDGPAARYPLVSRAELLIAQAVDALESNSPYHHAPVGGGGREGGLRTSFIDGFTRCPTRHSKCGLRLRIEAAAASVSRGRYDDPRVLRLVGDRGVGSALDVGRDGPAAPPAGGPGSGSGCQL